jgi:hypothetical protein
MVTSLVRPKVDLMHGYTMNKKDLHRLRRIEDRYVGCSGWRSSVS